MENGLGRMVEGVFSRAFKSNVRPIEIGRRMVREIDAKRTVDANGRRVVPNHFVVRLSLADREALADVEQALIVELETAAETYCTDEGYHRRGPVVAVITGDPKLPKGRVIIESEVVTSRADMSVDVQRPTPTLDPIDAPVSNQRPVRAAVLLPSGDEVQLGTQPIIIGRLPECDIAFDDSNVSRRHAEISFKAGEYVISDLGSTNGTKINGSLIDRPSILTTGDVITVGLNSLRFQNQRP